MNDKEDKLLKIAIVISHPIHYFCPQYASFANNDKVKSKVYFASMLGFKKYIDNNFNQEVNWKNINLDSFQHHFLNNESVLESNYKLDAPTLNDELYLFKPDLVIIYGYYQKLQRRAYFWAIKNKVKLAYISDSELNNRRSILKKFFKWPFLRYYFSRISFFLSVGDSNEKFYKFHGVNSDKVIRMHFPIDINSYNIAYENRNELRKALRLKYNIPKNEVVLCVVGKLVDWKCQEHIIEALNLLEKESVFCTLFIIGSGPTYNLCLQKAKLLKRSRVILTGFINNDKLPMYYAGTDIYVHPSRYEPHALAISESIYMGCPVVVSDKCGSHGPTDDVQEYKNGFIYEYGNVYELKSKIKILINNPDLRHNFSNNSHKIGVEFQSISHRKVLSSLISKFYKS